MGQVVREPLSDSAWAVRLPASAVAGAAAVRCHGGVRVCADDPWLWLVGDVAEPRLVRSLVAIPGGELFAVDDAGTCRVPGKRLPSCVLPSGPWTPIREWMTVSFVTPALPAVRPAKLTIRLVRGGDERAANVLSTTLSRLHEWVGVATALRTRTLRFAADANGATLVRGLPLPPLPGDVACEEDGVALPAGHRFATDLPVALVRAVLHLGPDDLACFDEAARCRILRARSFVPLTRAAVRATMRGGDRE